MRTLIGYSVWNKVDMIAYLLQGIQAHLDPRLTDIIFHFDACSDGSQEAFNSCLDYWLIHRGKWARSQIHAITSAAEVREIGGHNRILDFFMEHKHDLCLIAQDDQHFEADPVQPLTALLEKYGDTLGIVGGRDAYGAGYSNFTGSRWSESNVQRRLNHGEFAPLPYMNSGPVVYTRSVIKKVGKLDEEYRAYYAWDDYGHRAIQNGFTNGVMGMDLTHAKFGRMRATEWCDWSGRDLDRRRQKHAF